MLQSIRDGFGRWVLVVILGLIAVSFIFWGVDFNLTGPTFAAKVNGEEISLQEFERNLQLEQQQFQELYQVELDEELRRQLRRSVVDRMVEREAMMQRIQDLGYRASDDRLAEYIRSAPVFQVGGEFSMDVYTTQLAVQGMSPRGFEEMQREQLAMLDLQRGIASSSFLTPDQYRRFIELSSQRRQLSYALFEVDAFLDQVEVDDAAVAEHYEQNGDMYMTEEAASIEYVELSRADVAAEIEVTDQELEEYYARRSEEFRTEEERRARHILITSADGETPEETEARAAEIAEQIRSGEAEFEELAAEVSDDPGTAGQGGDLGWIAPGMLAGPFEDALFAMEVGEVRGPVQSDFGYHVIRLDDVREGDEQTLDEVRDELLEQYRTDRADELFYDLANELADRAFDAYDTLAPVAEGLDLELKTLERFPRSGDRSAFPNSAPVVDAVFNSDQTEGGVNSQLIELSEEHVAIVRVTERFPPEQRPLEEVSGEIRDRLSRERAAALAAEAAEAFRAALPEDLAPAFVGADEASGQADAAASDGDAATSDAAADEEGADGAATADAAAGDGAAAEGASEADAAAAADGAAADGAAVADGDTADSADAADDAGDDAGASGADDSEAARLAAMHGGRWVAPAWIRRSDPGAPTTIVSEAFALRPPEDGSVVTNSVELPSRDRAVVFVSGVEPGRPEELSQEEQQMLQQQLIDTIGTAELGSYSSSVRQQADVQIPNDVLESQF